ncbi:Lysine--tRNA ligase [bacterium HR11]|nr:Lysine--tRNA ligase [bacterium HR11]
MSEVEYVRERWARLQKLRSSGVETLPYRFETTHTLEEIVELYGSEQDAGRLQNVQARVAGRVQSLRWHGRTTFCHIQGRQARLQLYARQDALGPEAYEAFTNLDLGDVVGVEGHLFRTKTGELTLAVQRWALLAKCWLPLPEQWHGLTDVEVRYRRRYLDLIANPRVRSIFIRRSQIVRLIRQFLDGRGFIEVETPVLQPLYGGALARPFKTYHNVLEAELFLRIAPELYLKRLIVGNLERVYEVARNFRNEGVSTLHNPEFTMLELYQAYADYNDIMRLTEEMIAFLATELFGSLRITFQGQTIDLTPPWRRLPMLAGLMEVGGLTEEQLYDRAFLVARAAELGVPRADGLPWGKLIAELFERLVQPTLIQPTFVTDFPVDISPLARRKRDDPRLVERFELFIGGLELGNAFSELNDPFDQKRRFEDQQRQRETGDAEAHPIDADYVLALMYGLPPTGGLGLGVDRLTMLFCDVTSIREVILFPLLRWVPVELPIPPELEEGQE